MRGHITPKEIMLKLQNFMNEERLEGSRWRNGVGRSRYRQMHDEHRYVLFWKSCGKIQTIQQPDWMPSGNYAGRVRVWKSPQ